MPDVVGATGSSTCCPAVALGSERFDGRPQCLDTTRGDLILLRGGGSPSFGRTATSDAVAPSRPPVASTGSASALCRIGRTDTATRSATDRTSTARPTGHWGGGTWTTPACSSRTTAYGFCSAARPGDRAGRAVAASEQWHLP